MVARMLLERRQGDVLLKIKNPNYSQVVNRHELFRPPLV